MAFWTSEREDHALRACHAARRQVLSPPASRSSLEGCCGFRSRALSFSLTGPLGTPISVKHPNAHPHLWTSSPIPPTLNPDSDS
eukprot:1511592-Rhodomonas_salina.4